MSTIDVGCLSMGALGAVLRPGSWDMRSLGGQSRDRSAPLAPAGPQPGRGGPPHRPVDGGQCDIGHRGTVQQQERKDEFIRSEQVGEKCRGPGGTVAFDRQIVDLATKVGHDRRGQGIGVAGLFVGHAASGAVALQAVAYVEVLLEVVAQWNVQEWAAARGQLHAGRQATLYDGEVRGGEVAVQLGDEPADGDSWTSR